MIIKILTLAVAGIILGSLIKKYSSELLPFFEIALVCAGVFIIFGTDGKGKNVFVSLASLFDGDSEIFTCLFKGAVITVLTRLAADICRENGNVPLSDVVELGGRIMLITLVLPFIEKVTQTALSFL